MHFTLQNTNFYGKEKLIIVSNYVRNVQCISDLVKLFSLFLQFLFFFSRCYATIINDIKVFTNQLNLIKTGPAEKYDTRNVGNAQRDGRLAEYSWRPLFNAAKFG